MATTRAERRDARERWRTARTTVGESADALASAKEVLAANRTLIAAVETWEAARERLAATNAEAGWFARLIQRRRERVDEQLRERVVAAVARRKRTAGVTRPRSSDLPAHDWLKDAWR